MKEKWIKISPWQQITMVIVAHLGKSISAEVIRA